MIEVMVALVLTLMIFGVAVGVVMAGQNAMGGNSLTSQMQEQARQCLNEVSRRMMASGLSAPGFNPYGVSPVLCEFRECVGYDVDNMLAKWDPPVGQNPTQLCWDDDKTSGKPGDCRKDVLVKDSAGTVTFRQHWASDFKFVVDPDDNRRITITLELTRDDPRVGVAGAPVKRKMNRTETIYLRD